MAKQTPEINLAGFKISKKSTIPLYTQVYNQFREMILTRRLRPGDRLPSTRNLAKMVNVSRTIITQTFEQLILEGYLVGKTGSGTFVTTLLPDQLMTPNNMISVVPLVDHKAAPDNTINKRQGLMELISNKEEILPFMAGTPALDFFPYKLWLDVSTTVLKKLKSYHLGYESPLGYWPLRQEISSYLRITRAVKCEPEQVIVVSGSQQGLNLAIECLLQSGDAAWVEDPGYVGAQAALKQKGIKICPIPVEGDGVNISYLKENCQSAKLGFVTPSHQYPLGVTLSLTKRLQLLRYAREQNMWIFEDDYDSEFCYEGRPLASLQGLDPSGVVIYSGTFSKVLFPGLRLAYLVLPNLELVEKFKAVKAILDRQSSIIDQAIVTEFLKEGHFLRHIRKMRVLYTERQQILINLMNEHLKDLIYTPSLAAGMNLIGWLSPNINEEKLKKETHRQGLVVTFLKEYTLKHLTKPGINLGYTGFSKYKLKIGVEKLRDCVQKSI